jgi:hypothetical protein
MSAATLGAPALGGGEVRRGSDVSPRTTRAASPCYGADTNDGAVPFKNSSVDVGRVFAGRGLDLFAQWSMGQQTHQQQTHQQQRQQQQRQQQQSQQQYQQRQQQDRQASASTDPLWRHLDSHYDGGRYEATKPREPPSRNGVVHYLPYEAMDMMQQRLTGVDAKVDSIADSMARLARSVEDLAARMPPSPTSTAWPQEPSQPQFDPRPDWQQYMSLFRPQHQPPQYPQAYQPGYLQDYLAGQPPGFLYAAQQLHGQHYHAPAPYSLGYGPFAYPDVGPMETGHENPLPGARRNAVHAPSAGLAVPAGASSRRPSAAAAVAPSLGSPLASEPASTGYPPPRDGGDEVKDQDDDDDLISEGEARRLAAEFLSRPRQMSGWDSETESEGDDEDEDEDDSDDEDVDEKEDTLDVDSSEADRASETTSVATAVVLEKLGPNDSAAEAITYVASRTWPIVDASRLSQTASPQSEHAPSSPLWRARPTSPPRVRKGSLPTPSLGAAAERLRLRRLQESAIRRNSGAAPPPPPPDVHATDFPRPPPRPARLGKLLAAAAAGSASSLPCSPHAPLFRGGGGSPSPPPSASTTTTKPIPAAAGLPAAPTYADVPRPMWYFFYGPAANPRRLQALLRLASLPTLVPARVWGHRLRLLPPGAEADDDDGPGRRGALAPPPRPVAVRAGVATASCEGFAWYVPRIEMAEALRRNGGREGLVEAAVEVEFDEGPSVGGKMFVWAGDSRMLVDLPAETPVVNTD